MVLNKATFLTEGYTVQVIVIKSYSENKNKIGDLIFLLQFLLIVGTQ